MVVMMVMMVMMMIDEDDDGDDDDDGNSDDNNGGDNDGNAQHDDDEDAPNLDNCYDNDYLLMMIIAMKSFWLLSKANYHSAINDTLLSQSLGHSFLLPTQKSVILPSNHVKNLHLL